MITYAPRFGQGPRTGTGAGGGVLAASPLEELISGTSGNWTSLLLNANNTKIDDALKYLNTPYSSGVRPAHERALLEKMQIWEAEGGLAQIIADREGIRAGTTRAFLDPTGKAQIARQGTDSWKMQPGEGWKAVGADGGSYNPIQSNFSGLNGGNNNNQRTTHDMVYDPNLGIKMSRPQQNSFLPQQQPKAGAGLGIPAQPRKASAYSVKSGFQGFGRSKLR